MLTVDDDAEMDQIDAEPLRGRRQDRRHDQDDRGRLHEVAGRQQQDINQRQESERILVFLDNDRVGIIGRLVHRFLELGGDICRQSVPELRVDDHGILQMSVVGDRDVLLHFMEFLCQIIRDGILAAIDHAGLQGRPDTLPRMP